MSELQVGLLLLGIAAVAAVLAYNRWQEGRARRAAEQAFRSRHADVLLGDGDSLAASLRTQPPAAGQAAGAARFDGATPDSRIDYIVVLRVRSGIPWAAALEAWRPVEQRFGRRALLAGSAGAGWKRVVPGGFDTFQALQAAIQLVSRSGIVGEAEMVEFRTEVETLAARIGAEVSAPEMRAALDRARELDQLCADADIQVALQLVKDGADETFHREVALAAEDAPFQVVPGDDRVTLLLDVPRTPGVMPAYSAMARTALELAARLDARLLDDLGNALDERALSAIASQLEPVRRRLSDAGFEPGGPLAGRLFS